MANTKISIPQILSTTDCSITPYQVWKVWAAELQLIDPERNLPSQMAYNYDRNGLIVKGRKGSKAYTSEELVAFLTRWFTKNYPKHTLQIITNTEVPGQLSLIEA